MSTQSINDVTICDLRSKVDLALTCIANRYVLEDKFGIKNRPNQYEILLLMHFKKALQHRYCKEEMTHDTIEKINKIIRKYNG